MREGYSCWLKRPSNHLDHSLILVLSIVLCSSLLFLSLFVSLINPLSLYSLSGLRLSVPLRGNPFFGATRPAIRTCQLAFHSLFLSFLLHSLPKSMKCINSTDTVEQMFYSLFEGTDASLSLCLSFCLTLRHFVSHYGNYRALFVRTSMNGRGYF